MTRKKKLETSLEGLFSGGRKRSQDEPQAEKKEEKKPSPTPAAKAEPKPKPEKTVAASNTEPKAVSQQPATPKPTPAPKPNNPKPAPVAKVEATPTPPPPTPRTQPAKAAEPTPQPEKAKPTPVASIPEPDTDEEQPVMEITNFKPVGREQSIVLSKGDTSQEKEVQILIFTIEGDLYGVDVSLVQTIIKPQPVFIVPRTVEYIKGLINLRGEVVAVFDLRTRFGLNERPTDKDTRFVVVELGEVMASMVVDRVEGVETIFESAIEEPSSMVMDVDTRYLKGIAHMDDNLILILDLFQTIARKEEETATQEVIF